MPIQIEFQLSREDLLAFYMRSADSSPHWRRAARVGQWVGVLGIVCLGSFVSAMLTYVLSGKGPWWLGMLLGVLLAPLWFVTWPGEYRRAQRKVLEQAVNRSIGDNALGHYQLTLTAEKVSAIGPGREIAMAWYTIQSVEQNDQYVYLTMGPDSAFIVPKRAFPNLEGAERFVAEATGLWEASRH